jgi:site-specific DNA recombinase
MPKKPKTKRKPGITEAAIYARVSSKEQEKEGFSIPSQLKLLRNYACEQGIHIAKEFTDVETAKRTGRTDFNNMLQYIKKNPSCGIILVEKTDRLYRNIKDWVTLDEFDIEIHFVKEGCIISRDSHSSEKFLHGIKVLMAKNYIDNLSEEVIKGHLEKAEQGEWPSRAPVGYVNNKETHRIEVDPDKARFVVELFKLYASSQYSLESLVSKAIEFGLLSRNTMRINKAGIHRILNNPIYYGEFIWKGKRYIGNHEPILPKQLFDKVQDVFRQANHPAQSKRSLPFAGLVKCAKCGCSYTPDIKKGKYVYYKCTQFKGKCNNDYIREETLADLFADVVKQIQIGKADMEYIKQALRESQQDKSRFHDQAVKTLQNRYKRLQGLIDRAYEDKLSGKIDEAFWERKSGEWNLEMNDIQFQIKAHQNANFEYFKIGIQILELANRAYDLYLEENRQEQRILLQTILSNCTYSDGTLYPTYKKPFNMFAERAQYASIRG